VVTTVDGDTVNPFDDPFAKAQATVRTAIVKNPAGMALDAVGNLYVSDSASGKVLVAPPGGIGLTLKDNLNTPGPLQVDARGRSFIVGEAGGKVTRYFFGLSGKVTDTTGSLVVGASVFLETPAGTLPGPGASENRYKTDKDGRFTVLGLLAPAMGLDPVKIAVTIESQGKPQAFPVTLNAVGETFFDFKLNP
jgi:hypothetical protein